MLDVEAEYFDGSGSAPSAPATETQTP
jgi:hypothetical protein